MANVLLMRRVMMMRTLSYLLLLLPAAAAACTAAPSGSGTDYGSVRERLTRGPTRLFVGGTDSTGTVTARRWTPGGWIEGDTPLVIDGGEVSASVDAGGRMKLAAFEVDLAPIDIPEEVFKKPAQLSDVKLRLASPAMADPSWSSNDDASATLPMMLDLEWAIAIDGGKTPLGSQHLPPVDVSLTLAGDGDVVDATLGITASGELWSWAGLIKMTHIELALDAETVN